MLAIKILDIKDFMNKLLLGDLFDFFETVEVSITTFNTFSIEGNYHGDFFDTEKSSALKETHCNYSSWKELKSYCYSIIRGKRTPLQFKIIFQLPYKQLLTLFERNHCPVSPELMGGLFFNIQYKNKELHCTTGISFKSFMPDSTVKQLWDSYIADFLKHSGISFELL